MIARTRSTACNSFTQLRFPVTGITIDKLKGNIHGRQ